MRSKGAAVCTLLIELQLDASGTSRAAEATAEDKDAAKDLFAEGLELRAKADLPGSLEKFRAAFKLVPSPITGLEVARGHVLLGELIEGHAMVLEVSKMPVKATESAQGKKAREDAAELSTKLGVRIPTLVVIVRGVGGSAGLLVSIDGHSVEPTPSNAPRRLNPGKHVVIASLPGRPEKRVDFNLAEGAAREVVVDFNETSTRTIAAVSLGVVGIIGVGAGTILALSARSKWHEAQSSCPNGACADAGALVTYRGLRDDAGSTADWATIAFVVGGAALGTGAVLWLTAPKTAGIPSVGLGPSTFVLAGKF